MIGALIQLDTSAQRRVMNHFPNHAPWPYKYCCCLSIRFHFKSFAFRLNFSLLFILAIDFRSLIAATTRQWSRRPHALHTTFVYLLCFALFFFSSSYWLRLRKKDERLKCKHWAWLYCNRNISFRIRFRTVD